MGKQLASQGKPQAVFGQSLAEFALIGGLVSLVAVGGIGLLVTSFSGKQNELFGFFGQSPAPPAAAGGVNGNNNALQGSGTPALEAAQPVAANLDLTTLQAQNSQLNSLYEGLQNGTVSLAEVSGWYGNTAKNSLALSYQLETAAKELQTTNPSLAADLIDLAKTGKILAGWQGSVAAEAYHIAGSSQFNVLYDWTQQISKETQTCINTEGKSFCNAINTTEAAKLTQEWANTFSQQWANIQNNPGLMKALSANTQQNVKAAAYTIEANANIHTDVNALQTYQNSQTIQTEAETAQTTGETSNG